METGARAAAATESETTAAHRAAQNNPWIVGSPAWWQRHSTADGKPLQGQGGATQRTGGTGAGTRPPRE